MRRLISKLIYYEQLKLPYFGHIILVYISFILTIIRVSCYSIKLDVIQTKSINSLYLFISITVDYIDFICMVEYISTHYCGKDRTVCKLTSLAIEIKKSIGIYVYF